MLAWDPNQLLSFLTWTYVGTGNYDITFASTYPDQTATARTLILLFGMAFVTDTTDEAAYQTRVIITGANTATVRVYAADGTTPIDRDFAVLFW
jgi:hypothetical protein